MRPLSFLAPLSFMTLAGCAQLSSQNVSVEQQSACPVHLKVGQNLTLSLPSNPSTGYRWAIQDSAGGVLHRMGREVYSNPNNDAVVGSAGVSTWRFQAFTSGTGRLRLTSQQPWEPEAEPAEVFDCAISVN